MHVLVAQRSFQSFIENNYQSVEVNGRVWDSLWIIIMLCPLGFSRSFGFHFLLECENNSEKSVLEACLANEKNESQCIK